MTEMVSDAGNKRPMVHGVDMLRIFAAIWVACAHGAFLDVKTLLAGHFGVVSAAMGVLFNGSSAVAVFFIISGFCIHYPNVKKPSLDWKTFLVRRATRIGIPLVAIIAITRCLGTAYVESENAVLWSLYCELVYYALYPFLFIALKRVSLKHILYGSIAVSGLILALFPTTLRFWNFGALTWLFCAPAWLLGAQLAQSFSPTGSRTLPGSIWIWRIAMIGLGSLGTLLLFHTPARLGFTIGEPWSIIPSLALAYFWVGDELRIFKRNAITGALETLGQASYSLYLLHKLALTALTPMITQVNPVLLWGGKIGLIAAITALFFFAIERPAHLIAKRIKIPGAISLAKRPS